MKRPFSEKLGREVLVFDGGMGTMLLKRGLSGGELPELWNIKYPEIITEIHSEYIESGCDIITANTFGANRLKLADSGYTPKEVIEKALLSAAAAAGNDAYIALDIGPSGKLLKPFGDLSFEEAYDIFAEMINAGKNAADCVLIETMSDTYEMKAAVLAAKENCDLPVIASFTFDEAGKLLTGGGISEAVLTAESAGADVIGINCGLGPEQIEKIIPTLVSTACVPVCVNPNAGLPVTVGGKTIYDVKPREFGEYAARFVKAGAAVVGGCCGTEPEHIKCVSQAVRGTKPQLPRGRRRTAVSSYAKTVELSGAPKIIGERINPTGKPMMKKALLDGDYEYILREGIKQTECGADILDVNVGLPGIDEASAMERAVTGLQGVTDAPLQIDTSDIAAMERALRLYNGRPLINSVNGKKESLDAVLPLVKKYGAVAVALTLDENGIPDSAAGRIKIAEKILKRAESLEIDKSSLVFDALAMTVSTGKDNAEIALETLLYIKNTLGCSTVLGVSNISFGLPHREFINSAFFTMAMHSGLSAGIINPLSGDMMRAYRSYCALAGFDPGCAEYIKEYSSLEYSQPSVPEPNREKVKPAEDKSDMDGLYGAVVKGLKELAGATARMLLKEKQPLDIINGQLIPALDEVGRGFENKTVFLPQLLMSADAAKAAFEEIKRDMESRGVVSEKKGKIILATVKGDIHDIGKNIVKVLLENYGFDVIDLGKDVEPQAVADRAVKENVRLVGLSALMTTTVASMEETVKLLRRSCGCKIMVGGAVLNEEYAKSIGADFYSKDAMGSVRYADELFSLK